MDEQHARPVPIHIAGPLGLIRAQVQQNVEVRALQCRAPSLNDSWRMTVRVIWLTMQLEHWYTEHKGSQDRPDSFTPAAGPTSTEGVPPLT